MLEYQERPFEYALKIDLALPVEVLLDHLAGFCAAARLDPPPLAAITALARCIAEAGATVAWLVAEPDAPRRRMRQAVNDWTRQLTFLESEPEVSPELLEDIRVAVDGMSPWLAYPGHHKFVQILSGHVAPGREGERVYELWRRASRYVHCQVATPQEPDWNTPCELARWGLVAAGEALGAAAGDQFGSDHDFNLLFLTGWLHRPEA